MMEVNEPLLGTIGFLAAVVVTLVDGRRAPCWAALAAALGLAPAVASAGGGEAVLVLGAAALLVVASFPFSRAVAHRLRMPGVDPLVPVVARGEALFGPRSTRVVVSVAVLPAASWVTFNVPIGAATTVTGVLFPVALVFGCAAVRVLTARTINDVAVGVAALGLAAAAAWFLCSGADTLAAASVAAALAPAAAIAAGWLGGRHAATRTAA